MTKKKRRRIDASLKAKIALEAVREQATIGIRGTAFDFSSGRQTLVAVLNGKVRLCAAGDCEIIPDNCGVGRARSDDVDELGGRAKGRALRSLPYLINQGSLTRPFRLNTESCRTSLTLFQNFFGGGNETGSDRGNAGTPEREKDPDPSPPDTGGGEGGDGGEGPGGIF